LFLPPNTTTTVQPLDQGIIDAIKAYYCHNHLNWVLDQLEETGKPIHKIKPNLYQALVWLHGAKKEVLGETILNCWVKAGILTAVDNANLRNMRERKCKVGIGKYNHAYNELFSILDKLGLEDGTTPSLLLQNQHKVVHDAMDDES